MRRKHTKSTTQSKLARLRTGAGLSQGQLASELGLCREAISRWESGRVTMRVETIGPYAAALGVTAADVLGAIATPD